MTLSRGQRRLCGQSGWLPHTGARWSMFGTITEPADDRQALQAVMGKHMVEVMTYHVC